MRPGQTGWLNSYGAGVIERSVGDETFNTISTTVTYTNLTPHRTTEGVNQVVSYNGSDLITLFGAEPIVTGNGSSTRVRLFNGTDPPGPVLAAASGLGNGSAFFVSDLHLFDDGDRDDDGAPDLDAGSNRQFALNILEFLRPGAASVGTVRVPSIPEGFGILAVSVSDVRGIPLTGAEVNVTNKVSDASFTCTSNALGFCSVTVPAGNYSIATRAVRGEVVLTSSIDPEVSAGSTSTASVTANSSGSSSEAYRGCLGVGLAAGGAETLAGLEGAIAGLKFFANRFLAVIFVILGLLGIGGGIGTIGTTPSSCASAYL